MKIVILCPSQFKDSWFTEAAQVYTKKISSLFEFELVQLKSPSFSRENFRQKVQAEEESIFHFIQPSDRVFLMDEGGKSTTTLEFAQRLERLKDSLPLKSRVIFLIGGPYGVSERVHKAYPEKFSLSKMTLAHPMAILFLLEQIYRAGSILKGNPYHNA